MIRSTRILVNLNSTYTINDSTYPCEVIDISLEGLKIGTRQILEVEDLLKISLNIEGKNVVFFCRIKNKGDSEGEYGLRIEELHPEDKAAYEDYMLRFFINSKTPPTEHVSL
ncbi:MAG: PilZ domain-containing protein [Brevinematales bacterium]|nr:PilZ domain-containing protein [Brevinematales bacterium]